MIDLILKDIEDPYIRENFFRLNNFINKQPLFDGDFKFFDIEIKSQSSNFEVLHGLTFIPVDIIALSVNGDNNFYFKYQNFTKTQIFINADGPVKIRFLAGKIKNLASTTASSNPDFVSPGDIVNPPSPDFTFIASGAHAAGDWLTANGLPSNTTGVPVMLNNAKVVQIITGTQGDGENYTIGIYQHNGAGSGLTSIGSQAITAAGPKRIAINFPITKTSNVQLAVKLEVGNTTNLRVALIVKGDAV